MSGSLPALPGFASLDVSGISGSYSTISQSSRRNSRKSNYHLWELTIVYPVMTVAEFRPVWAFINSQFGKFDTFTVPAYDNPLGVASGSPIVSSSTINTVTISGANLSVTGWLKAGDVVSFTGGTKLYMVTADVNSDASGFAIIPVYPDLMSTPGIGSAASITNAAYTVSLKNKIQKFNASIGGFYRFEIDVIESLT